ncbi:MAG: VWA domain-containing protein [Candidatus Symbiothrix sp.]|nr:VWA domain-containing protein [Candidatus Symbiothrix sp.]
MKVNVFNLIILDESGSMESIKKPSLDGLNETLQSIRSAQETHQELQQHFVSLVSFNSDGIRLIFENVPVLGIRMLNNRDYQPNNCTPLYDAMGNSLSKLRYQLDSKEKNQVLVTIITDGYENASKEYTGKMIKNLVEELKALGWVFTYIGANQDVDAVADSISVDNRLRFDADKRGINLAMKTEHFYRQKFYNKVSMKLFDEKVDLSTGFFDDEDNNISKNDKSKDSVIPN